VGKALGYAEDALASVAKQLGWFGSLDRDELVARLATRGNVAPTTRGSPCWMTRGVLAEPPRHLGQHPGGMVLARGRLDDVVPLEPAAMPGRVVRPVGQRRLRRPRDLEGRPARASG
jgi:error-prone DNA polymerase